MTKAALKTELPRYVGYAEIAEATGIDRRTLQRLIARGNFPKPDALPTKENRWRLEVIAEWLEKRNARQTAALSDLAVTDPAKLKPDQVVDALQQLGARFASIHGQPVAPESVVGVTYQLTDEQRLVVAHEAAAKQRELIEGIVDRLGGLHFVEALMLQRAFLPPLRRFADEGLKQFGIDINMSDAEWREVGLLLVDRVINGDVIEPSTHPREVVETLANDGVLAKRG